MRQGKLSELIHNSVRPHTFLQNRIIQLYPAQQPGPNMYPVVKTLHSSSLAQPQNLILLGSEAADQEAVTDQSAREKQFVGPEMRRSMRVRGRQAEEGVGGRDFVSHPCVVSSVRHLRLTRVSA